MLEVTSVRRASVRLGSGEIMRYLTLPDKPYGKLKRDFTVAEHLKEIDQLDLEAVDSVLIKCGHIEDGLLAASYVYKKYEALHGSCAKLYDEAEPDEYPMDMWEEDSEAGLEADDIIFENSSLARLPIISAHEFTSSFTKQPRHGLGFGALNFRFESEGQLQEPYWMHGDYPIIVEDSYMASTLVKEPFEYFEQASRFLIYIQVMAAESAIHSIGYFEKAVLFESNMVLCSLDRPSLPYYERVLHDAAKIRGYRISKKVDTSRLIKELIDYRGHSFRSIVDIETVVKKAINKKRNTSKTITNDELAPIFMTRKLQTIHHKTGKTKSAASELEQLIGLKEVKQQLLRSVKRMKFDHMRKSNGYTTLDTHMAAVFMGNPGTAKTTIARIFGKLLCEEGVLSNDVFMEVSRKDLIGQYVGWTAPIVAKLFEAAKGGTIFIDEAYSLMNDQQAGGYSEEALSEIIRQMENNPDTLVLFAGYPKEMKWFIEHANPGLRSRLTHTIEFTDYDAEELCGIFTYLASNEQMKIENMDEAHHCIRRFMQRMADLPSANLGNGRLMRRLFKTAIGYMAERDDNDLQTLKTVDIERAEDEIWRAEHSIAKLSTSIGKIGFY